MRKELIDIFNEINHTNFNTLDEIRRTYSKIEILKSWLDYEGISEYASKIMQVVELIEKGTIE